MGSFLAGLFGGQNSTLNGDINATGQIAGFGTSVGEGDIQGASGFYNSLLSGNQSEEAKLLAPQIQNIQKQGQQQLDTAAQFGNRSGGTNAAGQNNIDTQRANVSNMISGLTSGAASGLSSLGTSSLGIGLSADEQQAQESQERLQNNNNSLLGKNIGGAINYGESFLPTAS